MKGQGNIGRQKFAKGGPPFKPDGSIYYPSSGMTISYFKRVYKGFTEVYSTMKKGR